MEASTNALKILLAESRESEPHPRIDQLRAKGHRIDRAQTGRDVMRAIEEELYDVVLINLDQPAIHTGGLEAIDDKLGEQTVSILGVTNLPANCPSEPRFDYLVTWSDLPDRINMLASTSDTDPPRPVINVKAALESAGDDTELLQSLIEIYFEQQPQLLEQIGAGIGAKDSKLLERSAHSLKGAISIFAAEPARKAAFDLETIGKECCWEQAESAAKELYNQLARFEPVLNDLKESIRRGDINSG